MHSAQDPPVQNKKLCKLLPDLFIADWLSQQNHTEDKDGKISGVKIDTDVIHTTWVTPECMSMQNMQ